MQARAAAYQRAGHGAGVQVATDRRRRGTGSATKRVVQRDHAGHADGRRVDGSASGVFVEVDVGGRSSSDRQTTGNDGRRLVAGRHVIGHRARVAAGVGHHPDVTAAGADVVVRDKADTAAYCVVGDDAVGIHTGACRIGVGTCDRHVAQHTGGVLGWRQCQYFQRAQVNAIVGTTVGGTSQRDALALEQARQVNAATSGGRAAHVDHTARGSDGRAARHCDAARRNALDHDTRRAGQRRIHSHTVGAGDQRTGDGAGIQIATDRCSRRACGAAISVVQRDDARHGDDARVDLGACCQQVVIRRRS